MKKQQMEKQTIRSRIALINSQCSAIETPRCVRIA